jgi:hypothetical protein
MATLVHNFEQQTVRIAFVLELYDGVTGLAALAGAVSAEVVNKETAMQKQNVAQFVFFSLAPGAYTVEVASGPATPYYSPVNIPITVPAPNTAAALWPAFPDRTLADPTKTLNDPTQTPAYLAQRAQATLVPTAQYPFPAGSSLARGTVSATGSPLAGAAVSRVGFTEQCVSGSDGQYVLFFNSVDGMGEAATLQAAHAPYANKTAAVTLLRGLTVTQDFVMA